MLGGFPPVVKKVDHLRLQGLSFAHVKIRLHMFQSGGSNDHSITMSSIQERVIVDPAKCSFRNADILLRMVLTQQI